MHFDKGRVTILRPQLNLTTDTRSETIRRSHGFQARVAGNRNLGNRSQGIKIARNQTKPALGPHRRKCSRRGASQLLIHVTFWRSPGPLGNGRSTSRGECPGDPNATSSLFQRSNLPVEAQKNYVPVRSSNLEIFSSVGSFE